MTVYVLPFGGFGYLAYLLIGGILTAAGAIARLLGRVGSRDQGREAEGSDGRPM